MRKIYLLGLLLVMFLGGGVKPANAEIIDRIEVNQVADEAEIEILFRTPIQYLRQATIKNGDIRLYFNLLDGETVSAPLVTESRQSPPSDIVPRFTVSYPELDGALTISFGRPMAFRVRPNSGRRSISVFVPALKRKLEPEAQVAPTHSAEDIEKEALELIVRARQAVKASQNEAAIGLLNRLLNLPPNGQSQEAQELIGIARESTGEFAKARAEYELYLKLYPDSAGAVGVRERLARLPAEATAKAPAPAPAPRQKYVAEKTRIFGSVSQAYYSGEVTIQHFSKQNAGNSPRKSIFNASLGPIPCLRHVIK